MVSVKVKTVKGVVEVFSTESYTIGKKKDLHPDLLDVKVYVGGRRVYHVRRHFQWFYKKYLYKPIQTELKPEGSEQNKKD